MTHYNTLNVKLSNLQPNRLKSGIKNGTEVTLNLSSNLTGNSNDEVDFPYKLLLTKFWEFVKLLETVHQLVKKSQNLNCLRFYS